MTRKSKRELERAVDDLDDSPSGPLDMNDAFDWLRHVKMHGADALPIKEYFDGQTSWSRSFEESMRKADPNDLEQLNPAEVYGIRYMSDAVADAIHDRRDAVSD